MRENVGDADALLRTVVGGALIYAAARRLEPRSLRPAALLAAGALLVESALTRVCPVNHWLGLDTRGFRPALRMRPWRYARRAEATPASPVHSEWGMAAELELPYDDYPSFQRPPADS